MNKTWTFHSEFPTSEFIHQEISPNEVWMYVDIVKTLMFSNTERRECRECGHYIIYRHDGGVEIFPTANGCHEICSYCQDCQRRALIKEGNIIHILPYGQHYNCLVGNEISDYQINILYYAKDKCGKKCQVY